MRQFPVSESSQAIEARRGGLDLARQFGFSEEDGGRLSIGLTELGTNLLKHAGQGEILIGASETSNQRCIEILALDKGPGMDDVEKCLTDGYSTAGSQGTGLGAIRRQATTFDIYSVPGHGTAIHARFCPGRMEYQPREITHWAAVMRPLPGEEVCGDALAVRETGGHFVALVADGLGHGIHAAEAGNLATQVFKRTASPDAEELIGDVHRALQSTRGAAVAVTSMDMGRHVATYCGIGNIAGSLQGDGVVKKMTSMNGTAGLVARRVQGFQYPFAGDTLLVMHSDGISSSWSLDKYPGLAQRSPMLIAAMLYRDFGKTRDDATVLVARVTS